MFSGYIEDLTLIVKIGWRVKKKRRGQILDDSVDSYPGSEYFKLQFQDLLSTAHSSLLFRGFMNCLLIQVPVCISVLKGETVSPAQLAGFVGLSSKLLINCRRGSNLAFNESWIATFVPPRLQPVLWLALGTTFAPFLWIKLCSRAGMFHKAQISLK